MRGPMFEERYPSCERIWLQVGVADTKSAMPLLFMSLAFWFKKQTMHVWNPLLIWCFNL